MKAIIAIIGVLGVICGLLFYMFNQSPNVKVVKDGKFTCGAVCGLMYSCDSRATEEDFNKLLEATERTCSEEMGKETSYRNEDGSLKHAVIIGDHEVITEQGTDFDSCVINWELNRETAFKAFKEVCLERRF